MPPMADAAADLPRRFRFVVFDWDGTLVDSTATIAQALLLAEDLEAPAQRKAVG